VAGAGACPKAIAAESTVNAILERILK